MHILYSWLLHHRLSNGKGMKSIKGIAITTCKVGVWGQDQFAVTPKSGLVKQQGPK